MFCNNFPHNNTVERGRRILAASKEKSGSAKPDVSKVLFPEIGKITNRKGAVNVGCT